MLKKTLVAALLSACGPALGPNEAVTIEMHDSLGNNYVVETYWQSRSDCVSIIDSELVPAFYEAAARIEEAAGIVIQECDGGTPIHFGEMTRDHALGETGFFRGERRWVKVAERVPELQRAHVLAHELGHWVTGFKGHAKNGIMADRAVISAKFNEESLNFICEHAECLKYQPEK